MAPPPSPRRLRHFQTVLVRPRLKANFAAHQALETRDRIGGDRLIGMTYMGPPIGIADSSGDIEGFGHLGHSGNMFAVIRPEVFTRRCKPILEGEKVAQR